MRPRGGLTAGAPNVALSATRPLRARRALAVVPLVGAALALGVHLSAVAGDPPVGMGAMFIVFPLGLLSWMALIVRANRRARRQGGTVARAWSLLAPLPVWARLIFGAAFVYALLNFLLFMQATEGGTVERGPDGQAVLADHGRVIRPLDERGVRAIEGWQVRLFSGHILPFLLLPGLYFLFVPEETRREDGSGTVAT